MTFIFPALLFVIFIACVASLYTEGMWSNAIRLINVVTAVLLATNFWEPVARALEGWQPTFTYLLDFIVLWALFGVFMVILRAATDFLSRVKVRFIKLAERIGSASFAVLIGWVMLSFATMTLHTAPLGRNFLFGGFQPESRMLGGLAPDRRWLGFVQKMSRGSFCRSATPQEWEQEKYVFDPRAEFMPKYATRRADLESHLDSTNALRVTSLPQKR